MSEERTPFSPTERDALVDRFLPPLPALPEDVRAALQRGSVASDRRAIERLGCCLWDIFSHGHQVVDADGRVCDLGSFRGSGDVLAERIEIRYPEIPPFDATDFTMGTRGADGPPPVYEWIFDGLRDADCDWIYAFPRIRLLRLGEPVDPDPDDQAMRAFAESLERAHEDSIRKALEAPLPAPVAAYRVVYGRLPEGWPHPDM